MFLNNKNFRAIALAGIAASSLSLFSGCGDDNTNNNSSPPPQGGTTQTLFTKYGGLPTIQKIVDDTVTRVLADCVENPYFTTVLGTPGHDTEDRLKACLDLQFSAVFGAPVTYPGPSTYRNAPAGGYDCEDMTTIHADLGIPGPVFDQFIADLSDVMAADGIQSQDIAAVAPVLIGLKPQVVSSPTITYDYTPSTPPGNGCTIPGPSPSPSVSPSPSPSVSPTPSPSVSPVR
jgi:hypothetical protein